MSESSSEPLLELPTSTLLTKFGEGKHTPGSGSAAVLSALIAVELMRTVCILTKTKEAYKDIWAEVDYIKDLLDSEYKPQLIRLFYRDSEEFAKVSEKRTERDLEKDPKLKEKLGREAAELLRIATEIPIETCKISIRLISYALSLFDKGYKAVNGDSGVAISNLLAAINGSLFVIMLNIKTGKSSAWSQATRAEAERLAADFMKIQQDAFSRVIKLYQDGVPEGQTTIPFTS